MASLGICLKTLLQNALHPQMASRHSRRPIVLIIQEKLSEFFSKEQLVKRPKLKLIDSVHWLYNFPLKPMTEPNYRLLSLLEKMINPPTRVDVTIESEGVFGFPEEWAKLDEANPFFSYKFTCLEFEKTGGKIVARQPTEEELAKIEEEKAAKNKKQAPPPKKGASENQALTSEEIEAKRIAEEEKLERERRLQAEWNALSPEEQQFRTMENIHKKASIRFDPERYLTSQKGTIDSNKKEFIGSIGNIDKPQSENKAAEQLNQSISVDEENNKAHENSEVNLGNVSRKEGNSLLVFEDVVTNGGEWMHFYRYPAMAEEELAKAKKKLKATQAGDLNPFVAKGWLDLTGLQKPGTSSITVRVRLEQVLTGDPAQDANQFPMEGCYIKIKITTNPTLNPFVKEIQPKIQDILPPHDQILKVSSAIESVNEFRQEMQTGIMAVSQDYANFIKSGEEKSGGSDNDREINDRGRSKMGGSFGTTPQQKQMALKKMRNDFVKQFQNSGKIENLKDKLRRSICLIVKDKFQKEGPVSPYQKGFQDQFYSELYEFLLREMKGCVSELINDIHPDIRESHAHAVAMRSEVKRTINQETNEQMVIRLAEEYEMLGNLIEAERKLQNLLDDSKPGETNGLYQHCMFNLRNRNFVKAEESLNRAMLQEPSKPEYLRLLSAFCLRRGRMKETEKLLNLQLSGNKTAQLLNTFMAFLHHSYLNDPKMSRRYFAVSQRVQMRKLGMLPPKNAKKPGPDSVFIPTEGEKKLALPQDQNDKLWYSLIDFFLENSFFELAEKALLNHVVDKNSLNFKYKLARIADQKGEMDEAISIFSEILKEDPGNAKIMMEKAICSFKKDSLYDTEELLFQALKQSKELRDFRSFLMIGSVFLKRRAWSDAKSVLKHACGLQPKSPSVWLGLGIACMNLEDYEEGLEALTQANICDPHNHRSWGYLVLLCLKDERTVQANQALNELFKLDLYDVQMMVEVGDELLLKKKLEEAETCFRRVTTIMKDDPHVNQTHVYKSLGDICMNKSHYADASEFYEMAEGVSESQKQKMELNSMKNQAINAARDDE